MFDVEDASAVYPDFKALPATVIPYFDVSGEPVTFLRNSEELHFCRVRYLEAPAAVGGFTKAKPLRYDQPRGSGVRAYFPIAGRLNWPAISQDTKSPLLITEGEKKALACTLAGFATVGLGGVFNYLSDGALLSELEAWRWYGRPIYIAFDSDAAMNPNIQLAESRLVEELMRKRGAKVYLVRLPSFANGDKCGLDDFLLAEGEARLDKLITGTPYLGAVDAAVMALNQHVMLIERDGAIYDVAARHFIKADFFQKGSKYSAETATRVVTTGKAPGVKVIQVAATWLTHPLARRYADLLFRPGEGTLVETEQGAPAFNAWHGWDDAPGDVAPFFALDEYLFSSLPAELRDYPLRLMAYKAQNPKAKVFAIVLTGDQGGGKSLWAKCMAEAFKPYSRSMSSQAFLSQFQGWMERTLLAIINEAKPGHLEEASEALKQFITDTEHDMNEKFRVQRTVQCYTSFILTANDRAVGAFAHDDRRMFVIPCPPTHEKGREFYAPVYDWLERGGARALMHYLLTVDLEGWTPGSKPPDTAEKTMARREMLTDTEKLAEDMRLATGSIVFMWLYNAMIWAQTAQSSGNPNLARYAQAIVDSYNNLQVRDWYTPEELSQMFPQVAAALYGSRRTTKTVPGEISRQLRNAGIRYLENSDDPEGFMLGGRRQQFLVIANRDEWVKPITQREFDQRMKNWPRYCNMIQTTRQNRTTNAS